MVVEETVAPVGVMTTREYLSNMNKSIEQVDRNIVERVCYGWKKEYQYNDTMLLPALGSIFIVGNGGSCAIAEHISTDLNKRCKVKALTLSNNSLLTALTNDYGQENALVKWMKISDFSRNDYLIAISSSGKSKNIINALNHADHCGAQTLSIFGMDGEHPFPSQNNSVSNFPQHEYFHIDSHNYGVVELTSEIILHSIVEEMVVEK